MSFDGWIAVLAIVLAIVLLAVGFLWGVTWGRRHPGRKRSACARPRPDARAARLISPIASMDADIRGAAQEWVRTGRMPEGPVVGGYSPRDLEEFLSPSEVFTALGGLRHDYENTAQMLQHPGDLEFLTEGMFRPGGS